MKDLKTPDLQANRGFWKNSVTIVLSVLVLFLVAQLIATAIVSSIGLSPGSQNYQTILYIGIDLVIVLLLMSAAMTLLKFDWKHVGIKRTGLMSYLKIVPLAIAYVVFSTLFTHLASRFVHGFDSDQVQNIGLTDMVSRPELVAAFIGLVILTPIAEELIFRGLLFRSLRKSLTVSFLPLSIVAIGFTVTGATLVHKYFGSSIPASSLPMISMAFGLIAITFGMIAAMWFKQSKRYVWVNAALYKKDPTFWSAAILTSIMFAAAHMQWNVAVDTFALSLALCYLVEKSDSILPSIVLHALKNSVAFTVLFLVK